MESEKIQKILATIYTALDSINREEQRLYGYPLHEKLTKEEVGTILTALQPHYPDYRVSHTLLSRGRDGQLYDIAQNHGEKTLALLDSVLEHSYIVVDWS
jgi:hypothetical protein